MNATTRYVIDIYQVSVIIRDTLEYLVPRKDGYKVEVYNQRKNIIKIALSKNHALDRFLTENKETGEKIRNNIQDFYDMVYGDESRAVFVENDKVVVDNGYNTQVLDYVIGLHETLFDICNGFIKHAKETNNYEEELGLLVERENHLYRCVSSMVITDQIHRLFVEFNKAMRESKGQATPQSNFISNELRKNVGFFRFVQDHAHYEDDIYKLAVDKSKYVLDLMSGKEKLDETGEGIRKEILNLHTLWARAVVLTEAEWRGIYQKVVNDLIAYDKEMLAKRQAAQAAAPATEETKEEKAEEKVEETK